jgi:glycerol-1-phosphate dehydrogenase [NAD(P)+]
MVDMNNNYISSNDPRSINIPNFFYVGYGIIHNLERILGKEGIKIDGSLMVSGKGYTAEIADSIASRISSVRRLCISSNDIDAIQSVERAVDNRGIHLVIAVGGGKVIDTVKYACSRLNKPVLVIPTALSNDGISSPVSVVRIVNVESVGVRPPIGIVVDIGIVKKAPKHTILAGIGDLISNLSAVEDWRLAHEYTGLQIDRFAEIVSRNAAERFIYYVLKNGRVGLDDIEQDNYSKEDLNEIDSSNNDNVRSKDRRYHHDDIVSSNYHTEYHDNDYANSLLNDNKFLVCLAEGLIQSGIAMNIAGSSRPASGAEHLISHALDTILKDPKPHGIQVGFATLFTQALRGSDITDIMEVYRLTGFPTTLDAIGISVDEFMEAIKTAPYTRKNRFTILNIVDESMVKNALRLAYGIGR